MLKLIENLEFILTVDAQDRILRNASMVIENNRIENIGPAAGIAGRYARERFDEIVDGSRRGACPGFIDAHVHMSETLSRAVFPDNLATRAWVFHWAKPFYAHVDAEDERIGVLLGAAEMLRSGTTCFLDMGAQNDPGITVGAMEASGIRGITGRHAADNPPPEIPHGWTEEMVRHHFFPDLKTGLAILEDTVRNYHNTVDGRVRCWVNIEGKEPCTLELHVEARRLAEKLGVGTTYHLATSIEEARVSERRHGRWPIARIADHGGLGSNLIIAHGVAVSDEEMDLLEKHGTRVAFCPATSFKLAKGATNIGRYPEMLDRGIGVVIGTDGVSAGGNLNLMRNMYSVAGLFKDARMDPAAVGARKALRMATIEAAEALQWADDIGSLEVGKTADLVLFDLDHIEWTPYRDPLQALVWSASVASIAETWVDGRALYRGGKVVTLNEPDLYAEARERAARVVERAGLSEDVPVTTTLYD